MALPLTRDGAALEALANWYAFTWRPTRHARRAAPALLEALARDLASRTARVTLSPAARRGRHRHAARARVSPAPAGRCCASRATPTTCSPVGGRSYAEYLAEPPRPAAHHAQAQGEEGRRSRSSTASTPTPGPPTRRSTRKLEARGRRPRAAAPLRRSRRRGRAACGWASRGTRARRSRRSSGPSRTAPPTSTSSRTAKAPSRSRAGTTLTAALFEQVIDRDRRRAGRLRHRRRSLQARLDGAGPPALPARLLAIRRDPRNWPAIGQGARCASLSRAARAG